jgi:periplasmic divalent cation tolerance protein
MFIVRTTVSDMEEAERIASALVGSGLTVCINMTPVRSIYRWKGEVFRDEEVLIEAKTNSEMLGRTVKAIQEAHGYEVPAIEWIECSASETTKRWIDKESGRPINVN